MATYTPDSLRNLFQSSFNLAKWYSFLQHFFNASELKEKPERIIENTSDEGYYLGNIDTTDSYRIGLFQYNITKGSVANKRVGLRNLVKSFINPTWGEFDAALVVFDSGDHWRLSFICDIKGESTSPKRYTYVFGSDDLLYRTPIERFNFLKKKGISFENLKTAFSVEALSDEFFDKYREQYADFIQYITGKRFVKVGSKWEEKVLGEPNAALMQAFGHNEKKIRDYVKKMMGRITFLHFLQRKGWMCGDLNYMQNMFENSAYKNDYLDSVLEPLFFGILNTKPAEREALFADYGWDKSLLAEWKDIPYLNGGLFERDAEDEPESRFPADYFKRLFQFFSEYNFTIDENDPNDAEVGVDPEMLGKIFENLLEDNKDKGAFYTPKEIVRYMCQESLIAYLETNTSVAKDKIRQFVLSPEEGVADIPENKKPKLLTALEEVKICDPAIGSGAFPMGLLNELLHCREVLSGEHYDRAEIKKSIIQNNIYGVDIEKGAVDIARLRFWLSIVVDEESPSPLPNLDYKIMQGNSLVESFMGVDLSKLTYEKEYKKDNGEFSLFDDEKNRLQKTVSHLLSSYYSCSDHDRKVKLQKEISDTINEQLKAQAYNPEILRELRTINLAENNKFFLWHTWFSDVFNREDKEGFDIVIGNPPYVNFANIKSAEYRTILKEKFYSTKNKCDLYAFFIEFGFDILNDSGIITYIVPHTWKATDSFSRLREILFKRHSVKQIVNLDMGVFDAIVQPLIMLAANRYEENSFINIFNSDFTLNSSIITEEVLASPAYIIDTTSSSLEKNIFKKIEEGSLPLSDFIRFSRGIKTSDDKRFIINEQRNSDCKKVYRGRNLKAYQLNWNGEYIWYRPDLMRQKVGCVPHTKEFFDVPEKLVTQRVNSSRQLLVAYDNQQNYFLDTTNVSNYSTWDGKTPLKYLCGLLNSKLINFWYCKKYLMPTIGGYELHSIPIKTTNDYRPIITLVDEAISAAQDNNLIVLSQKMKEIDKIVYDIYGLTDAEIKIIEQSI
ncbi:Eco57I restriction-modification methylase domain-containing protein [Bacteroides xylanisolvens]|uniref:Eco57I restriction-modification methylase domain-containing protein n=1 Tax=Bacteroides xylanisolvens TaxID=371601 RepID=UPI001B8B5FC5|nr:TaqI-like C-terminal specificity domain-containing protein [Bacteroides xylanisolvens]QUT27740.1 TaqI-like C-terminal specificity domain protein [Bacteroides xylanisolvens]